MPAEPPVRPGAEEARRWAAEELAKPEYREAAPGWLETAWREFVHWLQSLDVSAAAGSTVPGPVIGIVIAVLIAAAVIIAKPRLNPKARQARDVFEPASVLAPADYRRRAEASAAAGKWGDAVVDLFRALVRSAEDRTIIDPQPGRTADEVAHELAAPFGAETERLGRAAVTFDAIRYGNRAADTADYRAMASLDKALDAMKPARPPDARAAAQQEQAQQAQAQQEEALPEPLAPGRAARP